MKQIFVTGISTEVGKTIASAIIVEALKADYWKPIQSGDLDNTDTNKVAALISNNKTVFHKSAYELNTAVSPHEAAEIDGIKIEYKKLHEPETTNHLVVEGAGGLLVPLNDTDTVLDIIMPNHKVIVVSRNYLGSINHTLLTVKWLMDRGYEVFILFSGVENAASESIIAKKTKAKVLGRIDEEKSFNKKIVKKYAAKFKDVLESL